MYTNSKIDVVIPTKSNFDGLFSLIKQLQVDDSVEQIVIVADGKDAFKYVASKFGPKMKVFEVDLSIGIHKMWNVGIEYLIDKQNHIAFINDDVSLYDNAMTNVCKFLDEHQEVGLVSPSWTDDMSEEFHEITAFGGFCMCVQSSLIQEWRFDESMKWWYGDNDIISWVTCDKELKVGVTGLARCSGNNSQTIRNDPPKNFQELINNDARIYHEKWDEKILAKSDLRKM